MKKVTLYMLMTLVLVKASNQANLCYRFDAEVFVFAELWKILEPISQ